MACIIRSSGIFLKHSELIFEQEKTLLQYIAQQSAYEDEEALSHVLSQYPSRYEEAMATFAQRFEQRGKRELLLDLFRSKFSSLSLEDERRLMTADEETLTKWSKQLLFAGTPDQVFQEH